MIPPPRTSRRNVELAGHWFELRLTQLPDIGELRITDCITKYTNRFVLPSLGYDNGGQGMQPGPLSASLGKQLEAVRAGHRWPTEPTPAAERPSRPKRRFDRTIHGYRHGDWDTTRGRLTWSFFGEDQLLVMHFHHAKPVTTGTVEEVERLLNFGLRQITERLGIVGILPDESGYTLWVDPHVPVGESKCERQVVLLRQKDDFLEDPRRGQLKFVLLTVDFDVALHETSPSADDVGAHSVGDRPVVGVSPDTPTAGVRHWNGWAWIVATWVLVIAVAAGLELSGVW